MPVNRLNGIDIYWERQTPENGANAPRVLVIGGTGGDLRKTPNPRDGLKGKGFDLVAYDQRGLGQTAKPPAPYTMADYADDAAALIDEMGWDKARVIGVSFGGMVAQNLAVRHPEKIERLVLCCTSPGGEGGSSYPLHEVMDMEPEEQFRFMLPISDTRCDETWQAAHEKDVDALFRMQRDAEAPYADEPGRRDGARAQLLARKDHDVWDRLPEITCPTLVCGGKYDGLAKPESVARLADRLPDARLEMYEGGHLFLIQDPKAWNDIVAFLKEAA